MTFGVSDYVREVTSPDKVGSGPMSGRDATWDQHIRYGYRHFNGSVDIVGSDFTVKLLADD